MRPKVLTLEELDLRLYEEPAKTYICEECGEPLTGFRSYGTAATGSLVKPGSDGLHPKCSGWRVLQHDFWEYMGEYGLLTEKQWTFLRGRRPK